METTLIPAFIFSNLNLRLLQYPLHLKQGIISAMEL